MDLSHITDLSHKRLSSLIESLRSIYNLNLLGLNSTQLDQLQRKYEAQKNKIISESKFNTYYNNPDYAKSLLVLEAIKMLTEIAPKRTKNKKTEGQMASYKNSQKRTKRMVMEEENLDQAETLLAAKDLSDSLQKMAEETAKMSVDDLMPLVDRMKGQFGQDPANGFNDVVKQHLQTVLDTIIKAKDETDNAIIALQGGQTPGGSSPDQSDIGKNAGIGGGDEIPPPPEGEEDEGGEGLGDVGGKEPSDEFSARPETSGPKNEPLGRSKKEELRESLSLKMKFTDEDNTAKVYWNSDDKEWVVKFFKNGLHVVDADYFTNDKDDAEVTAKSEIKKGLQEGKKRCMECGKGMYEADRKGRMKCTECGHMSIMESAHHPIDDYEQKHVKGSDDYAHYFHSNGNSYQLRHGKPYKAIFKDADGTRITFHNHHDLKDHIAKVHGHKAKETKSTLDEDTQDYSTQDLQNAMKTGKTSDGKSINRIEAQKIITDREKTDTQPQSNTINEKAVSRAQQQAAGAALAAKRGETPKSELKGASREMAKMSKKELEKFAGTPHKGLPEKVDEAKAKPDFLDVDGDGNKEETFKKAVADKKKKVKENIQRVQEYIEKMMDRYNKLNEAFQKHKRIFARQLAEGKQQDTLGVGYGLEGEAIREKLIKAKTKILEAKSIKQNLVESVVTKKKEILEAKQEIKKLNEKLDSKPYAVIGLDQSRKKIKHVFESVAQRDMWLEFHKDTLVEYKLIDPSDINKAKQYLKSKMK